MSLSFFVVFVMIDFQAFQSGGTGNDNTSGGSSQENNAYASLLPTLEAYLTGTLEEAYTGGAMTMMEDERSVASRNTAR